eukprot:jgi/Mesvir1/2758/Mv11545-RA.1
MISRHLQQYVDNNCVGGAQMDVLLEDGVDGAKRAVIRLSEMDDDKEDVNIRLRRHDDNTADCVFGSGGMEDESQVFHDAAEKVVEWMMGWSNLDMEKGGPTSQVVGDSPPRGEGSEGQPVQAQGASSQQPPHKRARSVTPPPMVESGVSFAAVTGKDEYHVGREMVDDPVKRSQIERFQRLANGTRQQQFALYQDILNDKPEVAKVPYLSKNTFMPRFETMLLQEQREVLSSSKRAEAGRQGGANLQGEGAIAAGEPVSEGVVGSDGDTAKMTRFKEQADAYKLRTLAKRVVAEVRTETAPPEVRNQMMTLHQVAELIVKNACAPDGATQPEEIPSAKALIKWMQENLFEGKGKERKCNYKNPR